MLQVYQHSIHVSDMTLLLMTLRLMSGSYWPSEAAMKRHLEAHKFVKDKSKESVNFQEVKDEFDEEEDKSKVESDFMPVFSSIKDHLALVSMEESAK